MLESMPRPIPKSALPRGYETSKLPAFDVPAFLDSTGVARKVVDFREKATILAQGDTAKHVLYIARGGGEAFARRAALQKHWAALPSAKSSA